MELSNVFGLPAHPLIVHAVVVLVPLAALGGLAIAFSSSLRARFGSLVAAIAVLDVLLIPLATGSGEQLEPRVAASALVEKHTEMGEQLLPFMIVLAVAVLVLVARPWLLARRGSGGSRPAWGAPWVATAAVVLIVLGSVASLVQVARIGHSGAKAAWSDVKAEGSQEAR